MDARLLTAAGFPVNQYNVDIEDDQGWLYFPLAALYSPWLNEDSLQTFKNGARAAGVHDGSHTPAGGFYVARVNENLQVIVLNSNLHADGNYWLFLDEGDIAGMMAWFEAMLEQMRQTNQRAFFLQHHPLRSVFGNYSEYLGNLLTEYDDVLIAAFFGHSHDDVRRCLACDAPASRPTAILHHQ